MDKKSLTIVLAVILLVAFFLPFISANGYTLSGWNIVFGKNGESGLFNGSGTAARSLFLCLLIPLGALIVLFSAFGTNSSGENYGRWMPLIGILYLAIMIFVNLTTGIGAFSFGGVIQILGYAFWITLVASLVLLFNRSRT
jgi:hypothetical protein